MSFFTPSTLAATGRSSTSSCLFKSGLTSSTQRCLRNFVDHGYFRAVAVLDGQQHRACNDGALEPCALLAPNQKPSGRQMDTHGTVYDLTVRGQQQQQLSQGSHRAHLQHRRRRRPPMPNVQVQRTRMSIHILSCLQILNASGSNLVNLLGSSHPALTSVASYYFKHPSKQMRPLLVLLFAQAANGLGGRWEEKRSEALEERADLDWPLSRPDITDGLESQHARTHKQL